MIILNPVVVSVAVILLMCILRANVVIALTTGALACGLAGGMTFKESISIFSRGLDGGATIAFSYAILGAFASALAHSGLPKFLMVKAVRLLHLQSEKSSESSSHAKVNRSAKIILFLAIGGMSIACKNVIPVHIAFIPVLIPPLLGIFNKMHIDRRAIACIITFGVIAAYMIVPIGFGEIFLKNILLHNLRINGLAISSHVAMHSLFFPVLGMGLGTLLALVRYGRPRHYEDLEVTGQANGETPAKRSLIISCLAVIAALAVQLAAGNIILGALAGFLIMSLGGVVERKDSDSVVAGGFKMMAIISFTMVAAAGFGYILRQSGGIDEIVTWIAEHTSNNKALAAFGMLFVGFLISVGIGSSFSTVPIVASVYVPLGVKFGFSPMAIAIIVAISGVTGDAGSPASDSILGPMMGLSADGQHSLVRDTAIPAFLHIAIPAFVFGWLASLWV